MLQHSTTHSAHSCIYPGQFEPHTQAESNLIRAIASGKKEFITPPALLRSLPDHYRIKIDTPGFKAEDFIVLVNSRFLTVMASRPTQQFTVKTGRAIPVKPDYLKLELPLPNDVDTAFVQAEYNKGILQICLFKTDKPYRENTRIVVY